MEERNDRFEYSYSAPTEEERREIAGIRRAYQPKENNESKLDRLRALDKKVNGTATAVGAFLGVVGVLIFGLGMAMVLEWNLIGWGAAVGVVGCALIGIAYPVHNRVLKKLKDKYGQEILRLSGELLNENKEEDKRA